ncbi:MAG: PAS domain S-box protein [Syntrophales bacterium]
MNYKQYVSPEDIERVYEFYHEIYLTGIPRKLMDYEVITKDGSRRDVEASASLIRDPSGKPIKFRSLSRDITDRKRAEEELQRSEEKYRSILENIEDGYFELDLAGNMTFFNAAICRIANMSNKEILGMNYKEYASPDTAKEMFRVFNEIFTTGKPATLKEYEIIGKDGSRRNLELSVSLIRDRQKSPIGFRGIARDVTEKKRAEEMYRTVAEKSFAGVFIAQKGIFQYVNANVAAYTGYTPEELIGRKTESIVHPDDLKILKQHAIEMLKGTRKSPYEYRIITKDGEVRWIIETVTPIFFEGERALLGNSMDITERKQTEQALNSSFVRLRKALGATIQAMAMTVEARDPYTAGHQRCVADLARSIATEMGLTADQIDGIRMAGTIHDIGKISIPTEILSKPTKLTELEFRLIKTHSQAGYDILKDIEFPWPIARMVLEHHERMNGTGYPRGLTREQTLIESRILMVADVVEAMGAHRPYRPAAGLDLALDEISKNRGILYDPEAVDACLRLFHTKGYKLIQV